jgi:hypothetical protein
MAAPPLLARGDWACCVPESLARRDPLIHPRRRRLAVGRQAQAAAAAGPRSTDLQQQQHEAQVHDDLQQLTISMSRRTALLGSLQAAVVSGALAGRPLAACAAVEPGGIPSADVTVGPGMDCATIGEALQRAPPGGTVEVYGGRQAGPPARGLPWRRHPALSVCRPPTGTLPIAALCQPTGVPMNRTVDAYRNPAGPVAGTWSAWS